MAIEDAYSRFLELTGDSIAAAMLVVAEQIAQVSRDRPTSKALSVGDVAKSLKISPEKVRGLCRSGALQATNLGSAKRPRYVVAPDDLASFMRLKPPQLQRAPNGE